MNNYGKRFIIGFTAQYSGFQRSGYIGLSIFAPFATNVTILSMKSNAPLNYTTYIQGGELLEYELPISLRMEGTGKQMNGIEISSTENISVICLDHYSSSADGYLALPTDALGSIYVAASYKPYDSNSRANLAIISPHDNNTITFLLPKDAAVQYRGLFYDKDSPLFFATLTLQKLEALHISSLSDLSGTIILSSNPVVVISGVDRAKPTGSIGSYDMLESFLLPTSLWGKEYILTTVRTTDKTKGDIFRIFAYENNTIVETLNGSTVLVSGKYTELTLEKSLTSFVKCNKPCQVVQYTRGEKIDGKYSEPSMIVLPSVSQFFSYYRVILPYGITYYDSITLVIQNKYRDGLYMNEIKLTDGDWKKINGTNYVWRVFSFSNLNAVTVYHTSSITKFGLTVFGWNNGVSYAYPGGFALSDVSNGKILYRSRLTVRFRDYIIYLNNTWYN